MKKMALGLVCAVAFIASCGGSSNGSAAAQAAAENSIQGFIGAIFTVDCIALINAGTAGTCDCSGGGTVTVAVTAAASLTTKDTVTATATNCVDATTGLTYNGAVAIDDVTGDATADFATFGECTNVGGSMQDVGTACSGTISGTCAGESYTCNLTEGADEECECS